MFDPNEFLSEEPSTDFDPNSFLQEPEDVLPKEVVDAPKSTVEKLAASLQKAGKFSTATAAMGSAKEKGIARNAEGLWETPLIGSERKDNSFIDEVVETGFNALYSGAARLGATDTDTSGLLEGFQKDNNLTDDQTKAAWSDLGNINRPWEDEEKLRVQSDGSIFPNMQDSDWLDEGKALKLIDGASDASPAWKMAARANLPQLAKSVADAKLEAYGAAAQAVEFIGDVNPTGQIGAKVLDGFTPPDVWALENNRLADFGTPAFVRDYENEVVEKTSGLKKYLWGLGASSAKGGMKLASTLGGFAGVLGSDAAGQAAADVSEAQSLVTQGAPSAGLVGSLIEEVPSLAAQIAITRGLGMGAAALGASANTIQTVGTLGSIVTAGAQSAGSQFAQGISEGQTEEEARSKALKAGMSTAIITGIFQKAGMGGVEKIAAGKPIGEITMRDLISSVGTKELGTKVRAFATEVLKSAVGEASEEGIDQLAQAFLTADPDTNLANAWNEAEQAAAIGGFIGGVVDVGSKAIEQGGLELATQSTPNQGQALVNASAAKLSSSGLTETARALATNLPLPPTPAVTPTENPLVSGAATSDVEVDGFKIPTKDGTGAGLAESVFGAPDSGLQYDETLDPKSFRITQIPGSPKMAVTFDGLVTDRAYDPITGSFEKMDKGTLSVLAKRQDGIPKRGSSLAVTIPKVEPEAAPGVVSEKETVQPQAKESSSVPEVTPAETAPDASTQPEAKTIASTPNLDERQSSIASDLDRIGGVAVSANPTSYDVGADQINVSEGFEPSVARSEARIASVEALAVRSKADGDSIVSALDPDDEALVSLEASHPDATPAQRGLLLVANAVNGNASAKAALRSISDEKGRQAYQEAVKAISGHKLTGELGKQIDSILKLSDSLRLSSPAVEFEQSPTTAGFTVKQSEMDQLVQKQPSNRKGAEFIDSGFEGTTIKENLPLNSVITATDNEGNATSQRVVTLTEPLPDGGVRHYLSPVVLDEKSGKSSLASKINSLTPGDSILNVSSESKKGVFTTSGLVVNVSNFIRKTIDDGTLEANREKIGDLVKQVITRQFNALTSNAFTKGNVSFKVMPGSAMQTRWEDGKPHIYVNEEHYANSLIHAVQTIDPANTVARDFMARDFSALLAQSAYEELEHYTTLQAIDPDELTTLMRDLVQTSKTNETLRNELVKAASWRASADPNSTGLSTPQIMALFSGDSTLTDEALEQELQAVGHEFLASLHQRLVTGNDVASVKAAFDRWIQMFAMDKPAGRIQSLVNRLTEMANRMLSAIQRFYAAHRLVEQLPPRLMEFSLAMDELMAQNGFKAPDVHQIRKAAFDQGVDVLNQASELAKTSWKDADAKKQLRQVVAQLRAANGDQDYFPVTLDPVAGNLIVGKAVSADERKLVQPFLDTLNTSGRLDTTMRTSAMARDMALVLRHLNGGKAVTANSKALDSFDPNRLNRDGERIRQAIERSLEQASGLNSDGLIQRVSVALANQQFDEPSIPQEGFESMARLFIDGEAQGNPEGNRLALALASAEASQDLDRIGEARSAFREFVQRAEAGEGVLADRMRSISMVNRIAQTRALQALRNRSLIYRPVNNLSDLISRYAAHPSEVMDVIRNSGLDANKMEGALTQARAVQQAMRRMYDFPAELEYLVMGGKQPRSMRAPVQSWTPINAQGLDRNLRLMPLSLGRSLRPQQASTDLEAKQSLLTPEQGFEGGLDVPIPEFGSVSFSFAASRAMGAFSGDFPVITSPDGTSLPASLYGPILDNMAIELQTSSANASRLLGVEANTFITDEAGVPVQGWDLQNRLYVNSRSINETLTTNLGNRFWRNDAGVDQQAVSTAGFSLPIEEVDDGRFGVKYPDLIIQIPDVSTLDGSLKGNDAMNQLVSSGVFGDLLAHVGRFVNGMESVSDVQTAPLLSHQDGLTPAGFAHQLVTPKMLELLTITKGWLSGQIASTSSLSSEVNRLYSQLAPQLEQTPAFANDRKKAQEYPASLSGRFWDLYRMAKVANSVYKDAIRMIGNQSLFRRNVGATTSDLPVDIKMMSTLSFEMSLRQRMAKDSADGSARIALLTPVSATAFLDEYSRLDAEEQILVGKGFKPITKGYDAPDGTRQYKTDSVASDMVYTGAAEDIQSDSGIEAGDLTQFQADQALQTEESQQIRKARLRSSALMALFGGDQDTVLRYIHGPQFTSVETVDDEPVFTYNNEALDTAIREQLEQLQAEEITRGVVLGPIGSYDEGIRGVLARNPEYADTLESLLHSGGRISKVIDPQQDGMPSPFESDVHSIMRSVTNMIPGVSVMEGQAQWQGSQDRPAIVFVPDAQAPLLIMPFGLRVQPDERVTREALVGMVEWLGTYGNVDVSAQAMKIVEAMATVDPLQSTLKGAMRQGMEQAVQFAGRDLTEDEDAQIAANATVWAEIVRVGVDKALSNLNDPSDNWLNPETAAQMVEAGETVDVPNASRIIALALTHPQARKALILSMNEEPTGSDPSREQMLERGDLIGLSQLPGAIDAIVFDQMANLPENFRITDERGVVMEPDDDNFQESAMAHAFRLAEDAAGKLGVEPEATNPVEQLSEMGASPIAELQSEWASKLLHSVLDGLQTQPAVDVQGLAGFPADHQLTEMEARQLMAMMDQNPLRQAIAANAPRPTPVWNGVGGQDVATASDLMALSSQAAQSLRQRYNRVIPFEQGDQAAENRTFNYKTFSFTDALDPDGVNYDVYHQGRVRKGSVAKAEQLGAAFFENDGKRFGILDADVQRLQGLDEATGSMEMVEVPKLVNGNRVMLMNGIETEVPFGEVGDVLTGKMKPGSTVPVTFVTQIMPIWQAEAQRFAAEQAQSQAVINDLRANLIVREQQLANNHNAIATLDQLATELNGTRDATAYLETLRTGGYAQVDTGALIDAEPLVRQFFEDRERMAGAMAQEMINIFRDRQGDVSRVLSLQETSKLSKSPVAMDMTLLSLQNASEARKIADTIGQTRTTLKAREDALRPSYARDADEGIPSWYQDLTGTQRNQLMGMRRVLNSAVINWNGTVTNVARQANAQIPRLINQDNFLVGSEPLLDQQRMEQFQQVLSDMRNNDALFEMASAAAVEHALYQSQWFDPSNGLSSLDLSMFSQDRRVQIPEEAIPQLREALLADDFDLLASTLNQAMFPAEEAAQAATSILKQRLNGFSNEELSNPQTAMEVFRVAREIDELARLDTVTANKVVTSTLKSVLQGNLATDQMAVERMMRDKVAKELQYEDRRNTIFAPRVAGNDLLRLTGNPDDIAITRRVLAKYGEVWSRAYLARRGFSGFLDGMDDAKMSALDADQMLQLGSVAMSAASGVDYRVVDGGLLPAQTPNRPNLSTPILPSVEKTPEVELQANTLVREMAVQGLFSNTDTPVSKAYGVFDPRAMVKAQAKDMFVRLLSTHKSGVMKGVGAGMAEDGTATADLHTRIGAFLSGLKLGMTPGALAPFAPLHAEVYAEIQADLSLMDMVEGFVPGELFSRKILAGLMHHDSKIRTLFSRKLKGQKAARSNIAVLEYGFDAQSGREGFRGQDHTTAKLFHEAADKISGPDKFEKMSQGYLLASIRSYFTSGNNATAQDRAKRIRQMFEQADDGYLAALTQGLGSTSTLPGTFAEVLAMPRRKLAEVKAYFTEDTYRLLEERGVYAEMRDKIMPHIEAMEQGVPLDEGMTRIMEQIPKEARDYAKFLDEIFGHVSQGLIDQAKMRGEDTSRMEQLPTVPMRWQTFNRSFTEDRIAPTTGEMLSTDRSLWMKSPNRVARGEQIELLHVNGGEAPLRIISDMLYRMNVSPSYEVFKATAGTTREGSYDGAIRTLEAAEGSDGRLATMSAERFGEAESAHVGISAARAVALLGQEIVSKDMSNLASRNRTMEHVHELQTLGAVRALISASQVWRQTVWGSLAYMGIKDGAFKNTDFAPLFGKYLFSKIAEVPARILQKANYGQGPDEQSYAERVDRFCLRYASSIYVRSADGNTLYLDEVSRVRPAARNRPRGRISGSARPVTDAITAIPRIGYEASVRLAKWILEKAIASPEKVVSRSIFMHQLLRKVNERNVALGFATITEDELIIDGANHQITPDMLQESALSVVDVMATSDGSKKGAVFQPMDSVVGEIARGALVTFANHQVSTSSNSYAGWRMIRNGDTETKAEGKRLIATSVAQNVMFQLFRYETMTWMLVSALAALGGWDEEKKQDVAGWFHGIRPGEDEDQRRTHAMHWISSLIGGSSNPIGYHPRDGWSDSNALTDAKRFELAITKEMLAQTPGFGMLASTAIGSTLTEYALKNTVLQLLPGDLSVYERAGIVIPERWGGEGLGPEGDSMEKLAYNAGNLFLNDVASRSTLTGGITSLVDPLAMQSNAEEVSTMDAALIWGAQLPFIPREFRREAQRIFLNNTDAKIWDGSWRKR